MRSEKPKKKTQRFRFKSLFWAIISTLFLVIIMVVVSDVIEISKFGITWNSTLTSIYYLVIVGLALSIFLCGVISTVIVGTKKRVNLIALPNILLCSRSKPLNQCQKNAIIFYQWIGSFAILFTSAVVVSIHGTGIVIAALANPLQVLSTVATFVVALFYLTYAFADIYDHYEDMFNVFYKSQVLFFIFRGVTHALVILFVILFSYTYSTAVIFIAGGNSGVVSSIANILPIILLTFFTWLSKRELQKFVNFDSSSSNSSAMEISV